MDFTPKINWNRLVRYLTGESSPEKEERTREWILEDRKRARLMDDLREVWEATDQSSRPRDVDAAWEEISRTIELANGDEKERKDAAGSSPRKTPSERGRERGKRGSRRRFYGGVQSSAGLSALLGVVLLAVAVAAIFFYDFSEVPDQHSEPRVFTTKPGQRATVRLGDGSKVRLNADSRLKVRAGFGEHNRMVRLTGEAYFEVARDTTTSFVVRMNGARVTALGTAFNVEAYADANKREVAVSEGVVSLRSGQESFRDTVHLRANYLGTIFGSHMQTLRDDAAVHRRIAWTNGQLVFSDAGFEEVTRRVERWYDVEIEYEVDSNRVDRLNASFHDESLDEVVKAISTALDLMYRREGEMVVFYRRG